MFFRKEKISWAEVKRESERARERTIMIMINAKCYS